MADPKVQQTATTELDGLSLSVELAPGYEIGDVVLDGRFEILRAIGEGGMGRVYEAFDAQRGERVALKLLTRLDPRGIYLMKNEFRALAGVRHINLVALHELFASDQQWFFTMDAVEGIRFDQWVRPRVTGQEAQLDEARLRDAFAQLSEGIAAIHAAGKLHRDLKPSNVLVTREGRVVILDFGLAAASELGEVGQTVQDPLVCGTPAYMAPEQAAGLPATTASDLYACGVMLFEALSGRRPFTGSAHNVLLDKQRIDAPKLAGVVDPPDLAVLCDRLLARSPAARVLKASSTPTKNAERLIGRDVELAQLEAAYRATRQGQPIAMFVSGQSGIGKSELCEAFVRNLRARERVVVLSGRCNERESVPFTGLDSLVDDLSRFLRKCSDMEAPALMPREVYALARVFPVLGRVAAVASAPKREVVDPQELRMRALAAFVELLARIRDRWPLVLHIDDAQWLDRDAVSFLDSVLAHSEPAPMLLLLSHRSGEVLEPLRHNARWQHRHLDVGPLPLSAASELASRVLGAEHSNAVEQVVTEAQGNPYFVEMLSRFARQRGLGEGVTLSNALQLRLEPLESGARRLLEVLSIAGRPILLDVALATARATHADLDALHSDQLVRSTDVTAQLKIECYHDQIRASILDSLAAESVRAWHAELYDELLNLAHADAEQLAVHAEGAGDSVAAARYCVQVAERANEAMAFDQAALFFTKALELGGWDAQSQRRLRERLGDALANAEGAVE